MPEGANAVVMVEETERASDDEVQHPRAGVSAAERRTTGRRHRHGARWCCARVTLLNPSRVGALAALGLTEVDVFARPTVAILSTGNEIVAPGAELAPGQIYDINRFTLSAIVAEHGGMPIPHQTAQDTHRRSESRDRSLPRRAT